LGLAQVTAKPTIGAAATMVFHSSGVKSDLLAIEIASYLSINRSSDSPTHEPTESSG
jgi:hypothetical protein